MPMRPPEGIVGRKAPAVAEQTAGIGKPVSDSIVFQSAVIEDPAVQARLQPWVEMECHQLSHGGTVARLDSLDLGTHQVVHERQETSVQKLGAAPAGFCTFSFCMKAPKSRFSEHRAEEVDTVFFMPGNVEFDIFVPAGGESVYVGFSQEQFLQGARILNPGFWEKPPKSVVPLTTGQRSELKSAVDLWLRTARKSAEGVAPLDPEIMRGHLLQTVLQITTVSEEDTVPSLNERLRAFQIGQRARAFVDESLDADVLPTLVDICAALGVSERTLRYAFREYIGLSPVAYLRARRLNRVRAVLAECGPQSVTVTQVAMRYGFLHLGRFAGDYRLMFGETPSMTLAS